MAAGMTTWESTTASTCGYVVWHPCGTASSANTESSTVVLDVSYLSGPDPTKEEPPEKAYATILSEAIEAARRWWRFACRTFERIWPKPIRKPTFRMLARPPPVMRELRFPSLSETCF